MRGRALANGCCAPVNGCAARNTLLQNKAPETMKGLILSPPFFVKIFRLSRAPRTTLSKIDAHDRQASRTPQRARTTAATTITRTVSQR